MMEDRTNYVRVINRNADPIRGRYAGKDYVFKPNVPLDVHEVVAHHVFGFGSDDHSAAFNRLGWLKSSTDMEEATKKLKKITFADPPEMVEAPPGKKPRLPKRAAAQLESPDPDDDDGDDETPEDEDDDETGSAGPPVSAGGSEGDVFKTPPNGPVKVQDGGEADDLI